MAGAKVNKLALSPTRHCIQILLYSEIEVLANDADIAAQLRSFHTKLDNYQPEDEDVSSNACGTTSANNSHAYSPSKGLKEAQRDDRRDLNTMLVRLSSDAFITKPIRYAQPRLLTFIKGQSADDLIAAVSCMSEPAKFRRTIRDVGIIY